MAPNWCSANAPPFSCRQFSGEAGNVAAAAATLWCCASRIRRRKWRNEKMKKNTAERVTNWQILLNKMTQLPAVHDPNAAINLASECECEFELVRCERLQWKLMTRASKFGRSNIRGQTTATQTTGNLNARILIESINLCGGSGAACISDDCRWRARSERDRSEAKKTIC